MAGNLVELADLTKFNDGDPEFFLRCAEAGVRKYCGWHIAPSERAVDLRCSVGQMGVIMLPSLHVTDVEKVFVEDRELETTEYEWDAAGFINRNTVTWPRRYYWPVYGYPANRPALVTFTHGYEEVPMDVKAVILELAAKAIELPASAASEIKGGPFQIKFGSGIGLALTSHQVDRLAGYRIQVVG